MRNSNRKREMLVRQSNFYNTGLCRVAILFLGAVFFPDQVKAEFCELPRQLGIKTDCGYYGITAEECYKRNCCWEPVKQHHGSQIPWCFRKSENLNNHYVVESIESGNNDNINYDGDTNVCLTIKLTLQNKILKSGVYGFDIPNLNVVVMYESESILRVKIIDRDQERWEIPQEWELMAPNKNKINMGEKKRNRCCSAFNDNEYVFEHAEAGEKFWFAVIRKSNRDTIFNTTSSDLKYENQYLHLSTYLYNDKNNVKGPNLYGLGERVDSFRLNTENEKYTFFPFDGQNPPHLNLYSSHPVYIEVRKRNDYDDNSYEKRNTESNNVFAHAVLMKNSNGMDINIVNDRKSGRKLEYHMIGGVIDLYFVIGESPKDVHGKLLRDVIGLPAFQPYWTIGFHQCRFGYKNVDKLINVTKMYDQFDIPLEVIWSDIDHMDLAKIFTFDPKNFPLPQLKAFVNDLHKNDLHYVTITDPGVAITLSEGVQGNTGYYPYDSAAVGNNKTKNIFIYNRNINRNNSDNNNNNNDTFFVGKVWPGLVHFPSFGNVVNTTTWWTELITNFINTFSVSGLWTDMNEPSNFCDGSCEPNLNDDISYTAYGYYFDPNKPPYAIGHRAYGKDNPLPLNEKTVSMDALATISFGDSTSSRREYMYNLHSLYGILQSKATYTALKAALPNKRPFILTRSSFVGSGKYAAKWTGDNTATFASMRSSISSILNLNLFGIPMVGADICGFHGDTTEELCARWIALGTLYPFSRSHNDLNQKDQEPYVWPETVAKVAQRYINLKNSISSYYYTLLYLAHIQGDTVARSLMFEFPYDDETFSIDAQFMIGCCLLVSPVLDQGVNITAAYFPSHTNWFDYLSKKPIVFYELKDRNHYSYSLSRNRIYNTGENGKNVTLNLPWIWDESAGETAIQQSVIGLHLKGGCIVARQKPQLRLTQTRMQPFELIIAPKDNLDFDGNGNGKTAQGSLFIDDGISFVDQSNKDYNVSSGNVNGIYLSFHYSNHCIDLVVTNIHTESHKNQVITALTDKTSLYYDSIQIWGFDINNDNNDLIFVEQTNNNNNNNTLVWSFDDEKRIFLINISYVPVYNNISICIKGNIK